MKIAAIIVFCFVVLVILHYLRKIESGLHYDRLSVRNPARRVYFLVLKEYLDTTEMSSREIEIRDGETVVLASRAGNDNYRLDLADPSFRMELRAADDRIWFRRGEGDWTALENSGVRVRTDGKFKSFTLCPLAYDSKEDPALEELPERMKRSRAVRTRFAGRLRSLWASAKVYAKGSKDIFADIAKNAATNLKDARVALSVVAIAAMLIFSSLVLANECGAGEEYLRSLPANFFVCLLLIVMAIALRGDLLVAGITGILISVGVVVQSINNTMLRQALENYEARRAANPNDPDLGRRPTAPFEIDTLSVLLIFAAFFAAILFSLIFQARRSNTKFITAIAFVTVAMILVFKFFGRAPENSTATLWIGPFQVSELLKLTAVMFIAFVLRAKEFSNGESTRPVIRWFNKPRRFVKRRGVEFEKFIYITMYMFILIGGLLFLSEIGTAFLLLVIYLLIMLFFVRSIIAKFFTIIIGSGASLVTALLYSNASGKMDVYKAAVEAAEEAGKAEPILLEKPIGKTPIGKILTNVFEKAVKNAGEARATLPKYPLGSIQKKVYDRFVTVLEPEKANIYNEGAQAYKSALAARYGGMWGSDVYIIDVINPHNDCFFPYLINRLGLIIGAFVIVLFSLMLVRYVVSDESDALSRISVSFIALQAIIQILSSLNFIPLTGIGIPLLSVGTNLAAVSYFLIMLCLTESYRNLSYGGTNV